MRQKVVPVEIRTLGPTTVPLRDTALEAHGRPRSRGCGMESVPNPCERVVAVVVPRREVGRRSRTRCSGYLLKLVFKLVGTVLIKISIRMRTYVCLLR